MRNFLDLVVNFMHHYWWVLAIISVIIGKLCDIYYNYKNPDEYFPEPFDENGCF